MVLGVGELDCSGWVLLLVVELVGVRWVVLLVV